MSQHILFNGHRVVVIDAFQKLQVKIIIDILIDYGYSKEDIANTPTVLLFAAKTVEKRLAEYLKICGENPKLYSITQSEMRFNKMLGLKLIGK